MDITSVVGGAGSLTDDLLLLAHFSQVTRYVHVASYLVVVYDWLLCLNDESKLIFEGMTSAKLAYMLCRYWPILTFPLTIWVQVFDHDRALCEKIFRIPMLVAIPNYATAASILVLRIYAFTRANRLVAICLVVSFLGVAAYQAWVGAVAATLIPFGNGCYPVNGSSVKILSGYFLAALLWDCIATLVFFIYAVRLRVKWSDTSKMTRIFLREGAGYFVAMSVVNVINTALNMGPNELMSGTMIPMGMLLPNILACRLVINLRRNGTARDLPSSVQQASINVGFHARPPAPQYLAGEDTIGSFGLTKMGQGADSPLSPMTAQSARPPQALPLHMPWESGEESYVQPGVH